MTNYNTNDKPQSILDIPWIVAPAAPVAPMLNKAAQVEAKHEALSATGRDLDGKIAPSGSTKWAKREQRKATRLANRTFGEVKTELASKYGVDCEDLFL